MPIRKYKRNRFWWLEGEGPGGVRVHESTGQTDEREAETIRIRKESELLEIATLGDKATFNFAQAVVFYLEEGGADRFLDPLLEHFKETLCREITGVKVRAAARKLYPDAAYSTWNRQVVTPMRAVMNCAADAGKIDPVKIKGFSKKDRGIRKTDYRPRAIDRGYIDAFRQACDDPWIAAMMLFLYQTGARRSDVLRLQWDAVDLDARVVLFRDMKNGEDAETELTDEMADELASLRRVNEFVFRYRDQKAVYRHVKAACAKAEIPYLGLHQPGRHSFATELVVNKGIDVATAAQQGRWKSKRVLMDHYAHGKGKGVLQEVFGRGKERASETVTRAPTTPLKSNGRRRRKSR